ncbi:response regulator [uncultured Brevundimonas sp.]|uniref:response regulator n=1 Tax=uncultured Brevundimonas sp. TaxID=213418 RepID=UPI0025CDF237|nr:response regulator [uncultured Brevundimonas sp.]
MKVCAIDDDPLMLQHLEEMLTGLGCQVVSASDVDTGLKKMSEQHCDAAVVDILMPERDGLNFILEIRRTRPDLRIVAISGGGRLGAGPLLSMADGLGADATLVKPFSLSDLKMALQVPD